MRALLAVLLSIVACGCDGDDGAPADAGADASPDVYDAGILGEPCNNICDIQRKICPADVQVTCFEDCAKAPKAAGDCSEVLAAYITCLGGHTEEWTTCLAADYPPSCKAAHDAWLGCGHEGGCGPVECKDVGDNACDCQAICQGVTYAEACTQGDAGFDCTCSANGQVDKTCPGLPNGCAFFVGCCADELP